MECSFLTLRRYLTSGVFLLITCPFLVNKEKNLLKGFASDAFDDASSC